MFSKELFNLRDSWYKEFQCKLIPTVDESLVIGIRTPALRNFARQIKDTAEAKDFLNTLPHKYYEENNVHAFLIEKINNYDECIAALDKFLPFVDNWATCDMMNPKIFKKNTQKLLEKIEEWMTASHVYTIRFGIGMLMRFYLDDNFSTEYLDMVANIVSEEYYVNMMKAWFFATALAKQYEATLPYIQQNRLDIWSHNKAIQKAAESFRVSQEHKDELKSYKRK